MRLCEYANSTYLRSKMTHLKRFVVAAAFLVAALFGITSCAASAMTFEDLARDWKGIPATMTTYDQRGQVLDQVKGESCKVARDARFEVV